MSKLDKILLRAGAVALILGVAYYIAGAPSIVDVYNHVSDRVERVVNGGWTSEEEAELLGRFAEQGAPPDEAQCVLDYFKDHDLSYDYLTFEENYGLAIEDAARECGIRD